MNVVMQSTLTSEVELDAPNTTGVSEESKNLPLVPKKKGGKLAQKLILRMEKENIREDREMLEIPTLGPLGDKKFWDF